MPRQSIRLEERSQLSFQTRFELDVFGRRVLAVRSGRSWSLFYAGDDGKRRPASDLHVPDWVEEAELADYVADLCHESSSPEASEVRIIDSRTDVDA